MPPVTARSRLLAILGQPVGHSLSPAMHNAAITALGIDAVYVALSMPASAVPDTLNVCRAGNIAGNVTVPHKALVAGLVDRRTPVADALGAVNTFWTEDGSLVGDNTDAAGVSEAMDQLDAPGPWLVAGTGGSARAVAAAATQRAVTVLIRSRNPERGLSFVSWARAMGCDARVDDGRRLGTAVNATPLGLKPSDPEPVPADRLKGCAAALDLVYAPSDTAWVRACRRRGMRARDGRGVLVAQGVAAFARFFPGVPAPREIMAAAVARALQ